MSFSLHQGRYLLSGKVGGQDVLEQGVKIAPSLSKKNCPAYNYL